MKSALKNKWIVGSLLLITFILWTASILIVDVKPLGQNGTDIGLSTFNLWFHRLTDVNMTLYVITDWLGLMPVAVCMVFAGVGCVQLIRRRSLFRVDADILILGAYYIAVIFFYVFFEMIPVNYRPVLINGYPEASYPSSTTLLVLGVMPTLAEQLSRRLGCKTLINIVRIFVTAFSAFMVSARLICGVHWFTDIVGSVLLCAGLFNLYLAAVTAVGRNKSHREGISWN